MLKLREQLAQTADGTSTQACHMNVIAKQFIVFESIGGEAEPLQIGRSHNHIDDNSGHCCIGGNSRISATSVMECR